MKRGGVPRLDGRFAGVRDLRAIIEHFNLRRVYEWLLLAGLVGVIGGLGAVGFKWLTDEVIGWFWGGIVGYAPPTPGGEPGHVVAHGSFHAWALVVAPAIGGVASGLLVYALAPEAEGHGTDAAIRAYHREHGAIRSRVPIVKMIASALTIGSGGSAGREGPIAQIGAGFGSLLGKVLSLPERQRRILLAAGVSAGIGAIFRAPLAGAIFAAEVLYREPDIEAEVVVPALLSSIVAYSIYCAVHGFGHLFTGTSGFTFDDPRALGCYAVLGLVTAFGGIAFVVVFGRTTRLFKRWRISNYAKPAIGGALVGALALVGYLISRDPTALAVMGAGYGTLQRAVSETSAIGPALAVLAFVAFGKMLSTALTIGSGGSGGVFGPSMVIGGCLGASVGTLFHQWFPGVVPDVGPFTIVGMAGFFAGVAKTPISTLLMVADLTGNYALLLPSMLVVGLSMLITHRWTIYDEQVPTRADSPAHRGELMRDLLADLRVDDVFDRTRAVRSVPPSASLDTVLQIAREAHQRIVPVVDEDGRRRGTCSVDDARASQEGAVAADLATEAPTVEPDTSLEHALELLAVQRADELLVVADGRVLGLVDRRDVLAAYRRRLAELRA